MMKLYREAFNVMDAVSEAFAGCVSMRFPFAAVERHPYIGYGVSESVILSFSPKFFERSTEIAKETDLRKDSGRPS
jgi:hypothetical protein